MDTSEKVFNGKLDKIERYKWTIQDAPGQQRMVSKTSLRVDRSYQRNANESKILAIARDWSWIACGSIVVANRDGILYAIDGQHRVLAALRRSDITELPCLVFKTQEAKQEAKGFLAAQTQRKAITSVEKFRALVTVEDPAAQIVQELMYSSGHTPENWSSEKNIQCVGILIKEANLDAATLCKMWPIIASISKGSIINTRLVQGLLYIEKKMPDSMSLTDPVWHKRLLKVGAEALLLGAARASAFYNKGGARVYAVGMIDTINKGLRNQLDLTL